MFIAIADIPLNALGNYVLMYGKWGFPALGIAGIGYATAIVSWLSLFALAAYIIYHPAFKSYRIFHRIDLPNRKIMREIIRIGWPVGVLYGFETGLFSIATLMMGYFNADSLAAHQIALQLLTVAFMPSLGLSQASAIRVSQEMGAKKFPDAKQVAYVGLIIGIVYSCIAASLFWLIPTPLISLFIDLNAPQNIGVATLAIIFLRICAIFEIFDSLQVILMGILRGFKDTFVPMWLGLFSYWFIGIGAAYMFGFKLDFKGTGIWIGLALGIAASACLLFLRMQWTLKGKKFH
jgi:MATE family multidrug resistance protein